MPNFIESCLLSATVVALIWTKALDAISTYKFVGIEGECNPLAKWMFQKFGLLGGISIICCVYLAILFAEVAAVVRINSHWITYATVVFGAVISYIQYDVMRFNSTFKHSSVTRILLRFFNNLKIQ